MNIFRVLVAPIVTVLLTTAAQAGVILQTPAGLAPGDHFRFVFVTDGTTNATSANINDYNSFVQAQAGGATYAGTTVNWLAIASTDSVDAFTNIGQTGDAVYLPDGTLVANTDDATGLWLNGDLLHPINSSLTTTDINTLVWTGTFPYGQPSYEPLGTPMFSSVGNSSSMLGYWVNNGTHNYFDSRAPTQNQDPLYAISSDLVVPVPEPGSLTLWLVGLGSWAGVWVSRRRRVAARAGLFRRGHS